MRLYLALILALVACSPNHQPQIVFHAPKAKENNCPLTIVYRYVGESITLSWERPEENAGGAPMASESIAYNVYDMSGSEPHIVSQALRETSITYTDLKAGTYCWAVTATDELAESPLSETVSVKAYK